LEDQKITKDQLREEIKLIKIEEKAEAEQQTEKICAVSVE